MKRESAKHSSPVGRLIRRLPGIPVLFFLWVSPPAAAPSGDVNSDGVVTSGKAFISRCAKMITFQRRHISEAFNLTGNR
jgi:hypothetical protein